MIALESDDGLRAAVGGRFGHVLVDEFQDLNPAQYRLVALAAGRVADGVAAGEDGHDAAAAPTRAGTTASDAQSRAPARAGRWLRAGGESEGLEDRIFTVDGSGCVVLGELSLRRLRPVDRGAIADARPWWQAPV